LADDPILFDVDPVDEPRQWQPGRITSEIERISPGLLGEVGKMIDRKRFDKLVSKIEKEHPLASEYASDARYTWPDRWELLVNGIREQFCADVHDIDQFYQDEALDEKYKSANQV